MLELQKFMQEHENWAKLLAAEPYNLKISYDNDLVMFKYNQLTADFSIPLVCEARGIIFENKSPYKVVCWPFEKFFNCGEPYAEIIDWSTASVQEKIDGCFTADDKIMLADGSSIPIGKIVDKKLSLEVLSYNFKTGIIEPKKIVGWKKSEKGAPLSEWRTIHLRQIRTSLKGKLSNHCIITPTNNHLFFRQSDNNTIEEVEAQFLKEGDILYTPNIGLSTVEKQVILGTLLGDGSCTYCQEIDKTRNKGIRFTHSRKQKEYVEYKATLLKGLKGTVKDISVTNSFNSEKTHYQSLVNKAINECYKLAYKNYKKYVTAEWLNQLDWLGFAIWYMDDGSLDKGPKNNSIFLHTEGFSEEENQTIINFYNNRGYKCNLRNDGRGHIFIHFSTESSELIFKQIRSFICPSMQYKLPERHQGYFDDSILNVTSKPTLYLSSGVIEKIEEGLTSHCPKNVKSRYRYDIEVEDNHNYFCQGVLVHNSLMKCYYWNNEWRLATNGTINAYIAPLGDGSAFQTYGDLWDSIWPGWRKAFKRQGDPYSTYMFEMVSPYNKVVIPYQKSEIYFLGWRDLQTGDELPRSLSFVSHILPTPIEYPLNSLEEVIAAANNLPWDKEGYVVCDINFNRVKIKSPAYLVAHYAISNGIITKRRLIKIILAHEEDEFLIYCSEYKEAIEEIKQDMRQLERNCGEALYTIYELPGYWRDYPRKEIYERIKDWPYVEFKYVMANYKEYMSWKEFTKNWSENKWMEVLYG